MYGGYGQLKSEGQNVAARQQLINASYEHLVKQAEEREKKLRDSIRLFKLCNECEEVEAWVREKEAVLQGEEKGSTKEQMESMQKKYDVSFKSFYLIFSKLLNIFRIFKLGFTQFKKKNSLCKLLENLSFIK